MAAYLPPVGFHFKVEFQGIGTRDSDNRFQEVLGLQAEIGVEELPVGGENRFSYRLPTRSKYGNLVLRRGLLKDSGLRSWLTDAIENFIFRPVDINIHLLNEKHEPTVSWTVIQAYPVKWIVSDLKAQENSLVVETIELAYQYFRSK